METLFTAIAKLITIPLIFVLSLAGYQIAPSGQGMEVGATQQAVGGKVYYLSGSGVSASATTIGLTSFTIAGDTQKLVMADFGTLGCGTIEPGNATKQEFVSFTGVTQNGDGTATLSGVTRGLSPISPYSASTTLQKAHAGASSFVISNSPPCFYEGYANKTISQAITGQWTYNTVLPSSTLTATTSDQFVRKGLLDATAFQGAATSTKTNGGIVELATATEASQGLALDSAKPLALDTSISTSTRVANTPYVVVSSTTDGFISETFIATSSLYRWTGNNTYSGTQTFSGLNTFSATTTIATTTVQGKQFGGNITNNLTAGEAMTGLTSPQPVMFATTSARVFLSDANVASTTGFLGFVVNSPAVAGTAYVQTDGIVDGFSALTAGSEYYVQDAVGTIGTSVGTNEIYVGRAISTTQILIDTSRENQYNGTSGSIDLTTNSTVVSVPLFTREIIVRFSDMAFNSGGLLLQSSGTVTLRKNGITSAAFTDCTAGAPCTAYTTDLSWGVSTHALTVDPTDAITGGTAQAYYYR